LKIATLPIADTVLLHIAGRRGFFAANGLEVELIPFQSAMEKDAAVAAGGLDGHFCEPGAVIMQRSMGLPFMIAATTSHTEPERRVFGLVAKPGSPAGRLEDLAGSSIGVANLYVVDFMTDVFLEKAGLPLDFFVRRDVKKIPPRYQMLVNGRLDAALFPEPLLSMAELAGGRVLMDDRDLDMPLAAVALKSSLPPRAVESFRTALAEAALWAALNPGAVKSLMADLGLIPPAVLSSYEPPLFKPEHVPGALPDKALFERYVRWLVKNGALQDEAGRGLRPAPSYEETVYRAPESVREPSGGGDGDRGN
jgi:NitT/TauT family transport system substrate-binding protein